MFISSVQNLSFQRMLRKNEEAEFSAVLRQGKEKLGNTGYSTLIIPSASLPQSLNTGMGNLLDKDAKNFMDFAKQYWGINSIQLIPEGNYKIHNKNCILPYSGSAFDLGSHLINLELLSSQEYGMLLSNNDIQKVLSQNANRVDFENILPKNSPVDNTLRKAYQELIKADTETKIKLLEKIKNYSLKNKDWLEPKSIFEALCHKYNTNFVSKWSNQDRNLYNTDIIPQEMRKDIIESIKKSEFSSEIGFYEFKQYLAEEHIRKARKELNLKGIKLNGDMLMGFSFDEKWANPKAFIENSSMKWGLPALDLNSVEGKELLAKKVNRFANLYDAIRVDAAWMYVSQPVKNTISKEIITKQYGTQILELIENEVKKAQGENFNPNNIIYEFIADINDFNIFNSENLNSIAKKRLNIITSHNTSYNWGTVRALKNMGLNGDEYILGTTTHDSIPLRIEFKNSKYINEQIEALSKILKIPKEKINSLQGFIQARFAEPMRSKNNMVFFTEALNILDRYKDNLDSTEDYRVKLGQNYKQDYFKSLEKGEGLNIMDSLEKAFVAEGLDKKEPELYKKIVKYQKILKSPEKKGRLIKLFILGTALKLISLVFFAKIIKNRKKPEKPAQ